MDKRNGLDGWFGGMDFIIGGTDGDRWFGGIDQRDGLEGLTGEMDWRDGLWI
jgi:hypothetical protein